MAARPARRGVVLLVAVVAIAIATTLFASLLRLSVAAHRRAQAEAWKVQADWLAESGLERAAARLAADPGYQGETWSLPAGLLGTGESGAVTIRVEAIADQPQRRLVHVEANYPDHPQHRARSSKQIVTLVKPAP